MTESSAPAVARGSPRAPPPRGKRRDEFTDRWNYLSEGPLSRDELDIAANYLKAADPLY